MKIVRFQLLALFFLSITSYAQDECVRGEPEPIIDDEKSVSSYFATVGKEGELEENFVLSNGQGVKIRQYGCAHFGLAYQFHLAGVNNPEKVRLLKATMASIAKVSGSFTPSISDAISQLKEGEDIPEEITLMEGYEMLYLSRENTSDGELFVVQYDVAL